MQFLRKIFKIILVVLILLGGAAVVGGAIFIGITIYSIDQATKPITDISRYQEILSQFGSDSPLVEHFPQEIPRNAENVRLYFLPGFLQGGTIFQLQMKLPPEQIERLQAQFQKSAKRKYIPGSNNNSLKEEISPDGIIITYEYYFHLGNSKSQKFPSNYEILVLEDTRGAPKYNWNHPELYGVAIDVSASEIVYFAEGW